MEHRRLGRIAIGLLGITAVAMPCVADESELIEDPLDAGVADRGPLSTSLREPRIDLRQPFGFERVYDLPGENDRLMRVSGALYATFPRSYYSRTKRGAVSVVPNDTIFNIGPPLDLLAETEDAQTHVAEGYARGRVQTRLEIDPTGQALLFRPMTRPRPVASQSTWRDTPLADPLAPPSRAPVAAVIVPGALIGPESDGPLPRSVVTDDAYRRARVRALLQRAAGAAQQ